MVCGTIRPRIYSALSLGLLNSIRVSVFIKWWIEKRNCCMGGWRRKSGDGGGWLWILCGKRGDPFNVNLYGSCVWQTRDGENGFHQVAVFIGALLEIRWAFHVNEVLRNGLFCYFYYDGNLMMISIHIDRC